MSINHHITSHLDKLPLELIEPVISQLTFRDAIALTHQIKEGDHLWNAFSISPVWKDIWPMLVTNRDDFDTLASLNITVNGRVLDLTGGALDGRPATFYRHVAKEQTRLMEHNVDFNKTFGPHFNGFNFLEYTTLTASRTLREIIHTIDPHILSFVSRELPLDLVTQLVPWLSKDSPLEDELRDRFLVNLLSTCLCNSYSPERRVNWNYWGQMSTHLRNDQTDFDADDWARMCRERHPTRPSAHWSIPETKAFVAAYSEIQKKVNAAKADQLRYMGELYGRHHTRLKMPLAPQTPRENPTHILQQLVVTAKYVEGIIDLTKSQAVSRSVKKHLNKTQGVCRFVYPHTCLIPYDWCLRLWIKVVEGMEDDVMTRSPEHVKRNIEVAKKGIDTFYIPDKKEMGISRLVSLPIDSKKVYEGLPRTKIRQGDGEPGFAIHHGLARDVGGVTQVFLPINSEEIEWLVAFLEVVEWIESEYPEITAEIKAIVVEPDEDVKKWISEKRDKRGTGKRTKQERIRAEQERLLAMW
ncbi:hypothetical protein QBC38DRAFT_494197 [Podospora fimiseda]|uniref:F-box domain-containing protein n=1 Tax=Podospora fimiseda TaxID=252190 RepID=A0AAN7BEK9_9PEZI|nr:hypothetical protein QBC38DRAFT_494197 [Podospora fimiseda]